MSSVGEELLRPAEVCRRLGMPPSTLRIYSTKFAEVLSESAARPAVGGEGKVGYRLYTERDLVVLKKAKELLAQGLTYEQVLAELRLVVPGRVRGKGSATVGEGGGEVGVTVSGEMEKVLAVLSRAVASSEKAADASQVMVTEIRGQIEQLVERLGRVEAVVERLESERKKGFWRRLFG